MLYSSPYNAQNGAEMALGAILIAKSCLDTFQIAVGHFLSKIFQLKEYLL